MNNDLEAPDKPELVFAFVGHAGTRLDELSDKLKASLKPFGYNCVDIRLSELLQYFTWQDQKGQTEFDRIRHLQDKGDAFREQTKDGAVLARAAISEIRNRRMQLSGSPDKPAAATAYILHQLKHPDEVELLRKVYGSSFVLNAGYAPSDMRKKELSKRLAKKDLETGQESHYDASAEDLIRIDEKQKSDFGQNTRDTYPNADFIANLSDPSGAHEIERLVELLFGHPFHTPTPDEHAMFHAHAASLRSSDENRQVGAVIVRYVRHPVLKKVWNLDIIASGMNEVPHAEVGLYSRLDSPDARDQGLAYLRQEDRAADFKIAALAELIDRIAKQNWFTEDCNHKSAKDLARELLPHLKRTRFMDIGEFSRPVHAEMAALLDSARRGVSVDRQTMYVTTFPCHNCAKHIIAAGLERVVFLEPYPKSRANNLYEEEIELESKNGDAVPMKVVFCAFSGVAPRLYRTLFSMSERGAKQNKPLRSWLAQRESLSPLYVPKNIHLTAIDNERRELKKLLPGIYKWDAKQICP